MDASGLYQLRQQLNREQALLCFNGPISHCLIEEMGKALRHYLEVDPANRDASMDVFSVYIEMTQNIQRYASRQGYNDQDGAATVVIARNERGRYVVSAGSRIEPRDGAALLARVRRLAAMDKAQLKAAFKEQLHKPRSTEPGAGAGLGMIDMARKAGEPIAATLSPFENGGAFFSLSVVI